MVRARQRDRARSDPRSVVRDRLESGGRKASGFLGDDHGRVGGQRLAVHRRHVDRGRAARPRPGSSSKAVYGTPSRDLISRSFSAISSALAPSGKRTEIHAVVKGVVDIDHHALKHPPCAAIDRAHPACGRRGERPPPANPCGNRVAAPRWTLSPSATSIFGLRPRESAPITATDPIAGPSWIVWSGAPAMGRSRPFLKENSGMYFAAISVPVRSLSRSAAETKRTTPTGHGMPWHADNCASLKETDAAAQHLQPRRLSQPVPAAPANAPASASAPPPSR